MVVLISAQFSGIQNGLIWLPEIYSKLKKSLLGPSETLLICVLPSKPFDSRNCPRFPPSSLSF